MMHILAFVIFAGIQAAHVPTDGQLKGSRTLASGKFVDSVNNGVADFALRAPGTAPAAAAAQKGGDVTQQPVAVQIEESVLKKLTKQLSSKCGERYSAMLVGEGAQMHSFNRHGGDTATLNQCGELEGKVCHTNAQITEAQKAPDGRKLSQVLEVEGKSCLPKECTQQSDLQALASFMHAQTKEMMPGDATQVELNVNCAQSGGGNVVVGATGAQQKADVPRSSSYLSKPLLALAMVLLARA